VGIDENTVKAFRTHRCQCLGHRGLQSVSRAYVARVERFVQYLGQQGVIRSTVNSTPEAPSSLIAFREWLLKHWGLALVTVGQLTKQLLQALGADAGQTRPPRSGRSFWTRSAAVGPPTPKRSLARSESTCDSWQRVAPVRLASTTPCPPWRNGSCPRCRGTRLWSSRSPQSRVSQGSP
jgi:hypothetical protein